MGGRETTPQDGMIKSRSGGRLGTIFCTPVLAYWLTLRSGARKSHPYDLTERLLEESLRTLRYRAASVLWFERLLRAAAPAAGIFLAYAVAAVFGLGNNWLFTVVLVLVLAALGWEIAKLRAPLAAVIDRRIEAASGLRHRPLAALEDIPATEGSDGEAIWRLHQARAAASITNARVGWPVPFAAAWDPLSLRALLLLLLAVGFVVAGNNAPARLGAAFTLPGWPFAGPQLNAWITPPAYTGEAPIFLKPGMKITVLTGSRLTVILNGSADTIRLGGKKLAADVLGPKSRRADSVIATSGTLAIGPWWHRLGHWRITAMAPSAPVLRFAPASLDDRGLRLSWQVDDPYGLASLAVTIRPEGYPDALPEGTALPAVTGKGTARLDMRDSPYGGLTVSVRLRAVNLAGVSALSAPQAMRLPVPPLHDPTAILLSVMRQNLALTPGQAPAIARQMMHAAEAPPSAISYAVDAQLGALATALGTHGAHPEDAVARLQALIRQIEAGPDFAPSQALALASQALLQALAHGPPDARTLNKLLQAMQQALAQHLAALNPPPPGQSGQNFDTSALNKLAARIAADESAGRTPQAEAELQQLAAALQALQTARPISAAQAAQSQASRQAAQGLSQLIQGQAGLLDRTGQGKATPSEQGQLHSSLGNIGAGLAKAGTPNLPGLGPAGQAMQNAQSALAQKNTAAAQAAEIAAIQSLQKAVAALQNAARQGLTLGQDGEMQGQNFEDNDPNGTAEDLSIPGLNLPGTNPADAIRQEIIRLDGNPDLPAATHDYLHRLLTPDQ
jgi:Domain of unknown function (DUF4175)